MASRRGKQGAAALLIAVGLAWLLWRAVDRPAVPVAAPRPALQAPVPPSQPDAGPAAASPPKAYAAAAPKAAASVVVPVPPAASRAIGPTPAGAASRALRPGEFEICGHGIVQGQPADPAAAGRPAEWLPPREFEARWQAEVEALLPRLARSGTPGSEAAVALLQGRSADLVRLALREREPRTVQWAVQACAAGGPAPPDPACLMLPPRLWTELEPDNGLAWLYLMTVEPAAQQDAFHGLSRARRFDERVGSLVAVLEAGAPRDLPRHLRLQLQIQAFNVELSRAMPRYQPLFQLCPADVAQDANRREPCLAVAELLAERSGTVLARALGVRLGERSGWPAERVAARKRQVDQVKDRLAARLDLALKQPLLSCAQFETLGGYIGDLARQGEWAMAGAASGPAGQTGR